MNFHPQQSISQPGGDLASSPATGTHELSSANLSGGVEGQLNSPGDINSAHSFFTPDAGASGAAANALGGPLDIAGLNPIMPTGAESAALSAPLMPGSESQALAGLIAGANEPISPIIQMIMRMPGAMGLMTSFFEFFSNFFFSQTSIFDLLNPALLGAQAYQAISHTMHHLPISLSLLPGHAPIFQTLNGLGQPMMTSDLLSAKLNLSLGSSPISPVGVKDFASFKSQFNVSGGPNMNKMMFEGVPGSGSTGQSAGGILSGPGMTDAGVSNHIASNTRLFSDKIGGSSLSPSLAMGNQSQSVANSISNSMGTNSVNLAGGSQSGLSAAGDLREGILGNSGSVEPAGFNYGGPGEFADTTAVTPDLGPSGAVSGELGSRQLLAMENSAKSFGPTISDAGERLKSAIDSNLNGSGTGQLAGLKAKQLTLDSVKSTSNPAQSATTHAPSGHHATNSATSHAKSASPSVHSKDATSHVKAHHPAKVHHQKQTPAKASPEVEVDRSEVTSSTTDSTGDHRLLAEADPGQSVESGSEAVSYTVQKGDNLWNIARDNLGDGVKWQEVFDLNKDVLGANPDLIYPGTTIQLPGQMAEIAQNGATNYVVQPGDNLWNISKDVLGKGHQWGDIYNLNHDVIGANPSMIHPGQQLTLPQTDPTLASGQSLSNSVNGAPANQVPAQEMTTAPTGENSMAETISEPAPEAIDPNVQSYGQESLKRIDANPPEVSHGGLEAGGNPSLGTSFRPTISTNSAQTTGIPVIPANSHPIAGGPGAAQAATINKGNTSVVSSGIFGDLSSIIGNKK